MAYSPRPYPQRGWSEVGSESAAKLFGALNAKGVKIDVTDNKVWYSNSRFESSLRRQEHFDMGGITDAEFPNRWPVGVKLTGY